MSEELQKLEGTVEHLIFENRDTGYSVVEVSSGDEYMVVAGNLGELCVGEGIVAYGRVETHPTHGVQFKAQSCPPAAGCPGHPGLSFQRRPALHRPGHRQKADENLWRRGAGRHQR